MARPADCISTRGWLIRICGWHRAYRCFHTVGVTRPYSVEMASARTLLETPRDVLQYWFGSSLNSVDVSEIKQRFPYWFSSNYPEFTQAQFDNANLIEGILQNRLSTGVWDSDENPLALMAKVIVLDQFSRAVHRGSSQAFHGDATASALVQSAFRKGWYPSQFSPIERMFLCLALHHSEDLSLHEFSLEQLCPLMDDGTSAELAGFLQGINNSQFKDHHEIVKKFGRYPHRNILLGRESTEEEIAWLNSPALPPWAKSQLPPSSRLTET